MLYTYLLKTPKRLTSPIPAKDLRLKVSASKHSFGGIGGVGRFGVFLLNAVKKSPVPNPPKYLLYAPIPPKSESTHL